MNGIIPGLVSDLHNRLVFSRRIDVLASHAAALIPAGAHSVLDVGCGDGRLSRNILRRRPELSIDGVEVQLRPSTAIPVRLFDGRSLPVPDASRDIVMIVDVLHHTDSPGVLLREAIRVARVGVIIKDHLAESWWAVGRLRAMDWVGNIGHGVGLPYNYLKRQQWDEEFTAAKLVEVSRREALGLYPWPVGLIFDADLHFISFSAPAGTPPPSSILR
jgi:SAM-dependent methyltransferase